MMCDHGGTYWYPQSGAPAVYVERCEREASVRYRSAGMVDEFWGHRCPEHAAMLDRDHCEIEAVR